MDRHTGSLLEACKWLQSSGEYSDLKIFCPDHVFQVHKAIICPRSKYFAKACNWANEVKGEVDLKDEDSRLVGLMIDYLYQLDYDDELVSRRSSSDLIEAFTEPEPLTSANVFFEGAVHRPSSETANTSFGLEPVQNTEEPTIDGDDWALPPSKKEKKRRRKSKKLRLRDQGQDLSKARLVVNTHMYALADKYDIEDLKALAQAKFEKAVIDDWDTTAFARAAELAFETTPQSDISLRAIVIKTINEHIELVDYEEIQALLDSGNGIAWKLVQALVVKPVKATW